MPVFISYARDDEELARSLTVSLIKANVKVWLDRHRLREGDILKEEIFRGIRTSRLFVVLMSEAASQSEWVKLETAYALEREAQGLIEIVPLSIEKGSILPSLSGRVYLDGDVENLATYSVLIARRALDADAPPLAGEWSGGDVLRYTHFGNEVSLDRNGRLKIEIDVVSFDLDCPYSIITRFQFISAEAAEMPEDGGRSIRDEVLRLCAADAGQSPWIAKLSRGDPSAGTFGVESSSHRFTATYRITRVGKVNRGIVIFNVGALFAQMLSRSEVGE